MKSHGSSSRHHTILSYLNVLPRQLIAMHGVEQSAAYVLHELCRARCFNLAKAAYFVDNPDFDCLHGIAGYYKNDHDSSYENGHDEDTHDASFNNGERLYEELIAHLDGCKFNREVRTIGCASHKRARKNKEELLNELAQKLMMKNPGCFIWPLKHDNHGVLIYEVADSCLDQDLENCLYNSLHLLGFCPVIPERY